MTRKASGFGRRWRSRRWALVAAAIATVAGCRRTALSEADAAPPGGVRDGSAERSDAAPLPGDAASDAATAEVGGADRGQCAPVDCFTGRPPVCGDCIDNDGDGLIDLDDHECTHPCDGSEDGLSVPAEAGDDTRMP